jgi:ribonuclease-3
VLGCAVADELYARFPQLPEGKLTQLRARLVRQESLVERAKSLGLERELRTGTVKDSVLADSFEAVLGAIFLDGGYAAARRAVVHAFGTLLERLDPSNVEKDPKTRLQELLHARGKPAPQYQVAATHGAPHERSFEVECVVGEARTRGQGSSRQRAEQEAARAMLARLEP